MLSEQELRRILPGRRQLLEFTAVIVMHQVLSDHGLLTLLALNSCFLAGFDVLRVFHYVFKNLATAKRTLDLFHDALGRVLLQLLVAHLFMAVHALHQFAVEDILERSPYLGDLKAAGSAARTLSSEWIPINKIVRAKLTIKLFACSVVAFLGVGHESLANNANDLVVLCMTIYQFRLVNDLFSVGRCNF